MTESRSSRSSSALSKVVNLRQQLSSVAWVQCDITTCMKWRKVDKAVADKLTSNTWWECSMNKDPLFNACNIPEEDLQSFDKLAKRAKLVVFKSELTPGSLVWAKTSGYCMWPALVTEDPANGEYWEGDEDEPEKGYYHVEFLGKCHCHIWVYAKSVELFGEGNVTLASQKNVSNDKISKDQQNARKRKRTKALHSQITKREKKMYGGGTVKMAIQEAIKLLPLTQEKRLKVCRFVKDNTNLVAKRKGIDVAVGHNQNFKHGIPLSKKKQQRNKKPRLDNDSNRDECVRCAESDMDYAHSCSSQRKNNVSFDFLTSLLDVSKEERFFLDISMYKEKEHYFRENLENFCSCFGLPIPINAIIWDDTKVNFFDLFLVVDDRGGFEEVSRSRQWSRVYLELTNYPSKEGAKNARSAYKKYLYPYELYINDKDISSVIKREKNCMKPSKQTYTPSTAKCESESDMDDAEFVQALDELDDLLRSLQQIDGVVPDLHDNVTHFQQDCDEDIQGAWDLIESSKKCDHVDPITGSQPCTAVEPEENAQVVPEMDFPSISESSTSNSDEMEHETEEERNQPPVQHNNEEEWVLQELQALEHGI